MSRIDRPQEKSNYSYKEMMERLRRKGSSSSASPGSSEAPASSGSSEGSSQPVRREVVERADGTQEIAEVRRRRKRRSHQPKKVRERRIRRMKRGLVLIGVPILLGIVGLYFLMLSRIKGEGFRADASERVGAMLGADVEFSRFRLRALTLNSRRALITAPPESLLREAEIAGMKAQLRASSLLSSDWNLGMISIGSGRFRFGPSGTNARSAGIGNVSALNRLPLTAGGIGLDADPAVINASGLKVANTDFFWKDSSHPFVTATTASTGELGGLTSLRFTGGKLSVPGWPELGIGSTAGELSRGVYRISRAALKHADNGIASLSGSIDTKRAGEFALKVEYSNISVREIVHPYWSDKISGRIEGNLSISGRLSQPESLVAKGNFSGRNVILGSNHILNRLSSAIGEAPLARAQFRKLSGDYDRRDGRTTFSNLDAEHESLLRLRGTITVDQDERLSGEFEVGIPTAILAKMEGGRPEFFGEEIDGFSWATTTISGLVDEPRDDLTPRLKAAREAAIEHDRRSLAPRKPAASVPAAPGDSGAFDRLSQP